MSSTAIDFARNEFFRKPSWRWDIAKRLLGASRRRRDESDEWINSAIRFLGPNKPGDPAIKKALEIAGSNSPLQWTLESYLLTSAPFKEVATTCGLTVSVVVAFEKLFFDVRDHLRAKDWIISRVIKSAPWKNLPGNQPATLWRHIGFFAGAEILSVVIAVMTDQPLPASVRKGSQTAEIDESLLRQKVRLMLAAMTAPVEELASIIDCRQELREIERTVRPIAEPSPSLKAQEEFLKKLGCKNDSRSKNSMASAGTKKGQRSGRRNPSAKNSVPNVAKFFKGLR